MVRMKVSRSPCLLVYTNEKAVSINAQGQPISSEEGLSFLKRFLVPI